MRRKFRLTKSAEYKRVRRYGKSFAHPLIVLIALPNDLHLSQIAVTTGYSIGNAIIRNRAKRRIRACIQPYMEQIRPGWNLVFIARHPLILSSFQQLNNAVYETLLKANLLLDNNDNKRIFNERASNIGTTS